MVFNRLCVGLHKKVWNKLVFTLNTYKLLPSLSRGAQISENVRSYCKFMKILGTSVHIYTYLFPANLFIWKCTSSGNMPLTTSISDCGRDPGQPTLKSQIASNCPSKQCCSKVIISFMGLAKLCFLVFSTYFDTIAHFYCEQSFYLVMKMGMGIQI